MVIIILFICYDKINYFLGDMLLANADPLGYFPEMKNIKLLEGDDYSCNIEFYFNNLLRVIS